MSQTKLNELVKAYLSSREGRDLVLEKVFALVYDRHRIYGFDDEDDAANALLRFRGRIGHLVDRFEDRGLPFDAYLAANLRYLARTARRERHRVREREVVCEREAAMSSLYGPNPEPWSPGASEYPAPAGMVTGKRPPSKRRPRARGGLIPSCPVQAAAYSSRLVFLAIKCAWEMDEEATARVAASAGVGCEWLGAAIEQARRSMESERASVERLSLRRNAAWTRLRLFETRLAAEVDPYRRTLIEASMRKEAARFEKVKEELSSLRTIVPNSLVARILGIPKGTVDSGLYYLRKRSPPQGDPHPDLLASGAGRRISSR